MEEVALADFAAEAGIVLDGEAGVRRTVPPAATDEKTM